jgi:hypothetical protein
LSVTPYTDKELCALAFDCENQADFPILRWNVTVPGSKPTPRPPQPPMVCLRIIEIINSLEFLITIQFRKIFVR